MNSAVIDQIKDILNARGLHLDDLKNPVTEKALQTRRSILFLLFQNNCTHTQMAKFLDIPVKTAASIVLAKEANGNDPKSRDINSVIASEIHDFTRKGGR